MRFIDTLRLVFNKKVNNIKPQYDMTGKRFIYCNGEMISYRDIMKLKRQYQYITFISVFIMICCYCYIVKLWLG